MSERRKSYIEQICPECVFKPTYPQVFKFDFVLPDKNYGELEIIIEKDDKIQIKGHIEAVKKLDEIGKELAGQELDYIFPFLEKVIYPPSTLLELSSVLWQLKSTFTLKQNQALENRDYHRMLRFFRNIYKPINKEILYEKTGIKIQY